MVRLTPAYVYAFKLTGLEDSTIQASKALRTFTIDFIGVNQPLQQEIISNLLTQMFPTLTLSQLQDFSHTQSMSLQIYSQGVI